jgi:hypothetical protein
MTGSRGGLKNGAMAFLKSGAAGTAGAAGIAGAAGEPAFRVAESGVASFLVATVAIASLLLFDAILRPPAG